MDYQNAFRFHSLWGYCFEFTLLFDSLSFTKERTSFKTDFKRQTPEHYYVSICNSPLCNPFWALFGRTFHQNLLNRG